MRSVTVRAFAKANRIRVPAEVLRKFGGLPIRYNGRLRVSMGVCKGRNGIAYAIDLNPKLRGTDRLRDTLLHELAHAVAGTGEGHNWRWMQAARLLGANPKRCYTQAEAAKLGIERAARRLVAACGTCGYKVHRRRALAKGRRYEHVRCGGELIKVRDRAHRLRPAGSIKQTQNTRERKQ
jgi:predicted SprT family Zn-dependent metalloprotease